MIYRIFQTILVVVALIAFILSLVFAYLNTAAYKPLYYSSNGFVDSKYYQQVSPVGTAFGIIWPIIYLWNCVGIAYIVISLFLDEDKSPVNSKPTLIPITFLIGYILSLTSTVGWLFAFDREILGLCLPLLLSAAGFMYFAIGVSYKRVFDNLECLEKKGRKVMLWLVRILIQNGLCVLATWLTLATFLGLAEIIIYQDSFGIVPAVQRGNISVEDGSTVVLALLFTYIIVWFILDNFVLEKYTRYTFTVFPVFILGLSGLVAKLRFDEGTRNLIFASVILGFCVSALIFRIIYFIYRSKTRCRTIHATVSETEMANHQKEKA